MGLTYCCMSKPKEENNPSDLKNYQERIDLIKKKNLDFSGRSEHLEDHFNNRDDEESLLNFDDTDMGRYDIFEHKFPFYRMDVNGFTFHVDAAMIDQSDDKERAQFIEKVALESLAKEFTNYSYKWAELNGKETGLSRFLRSSCLFESEGEAVDISVFDLKILGILLCKGSDKEKFFELWSLI